MWQVPVLPQVSKKINEKKITQSCCVQDHGPMLVHTRRQGGGAKERVVWMVREVQVKVPRGLQQGDRVHHHQQ